MDEGIFVGWLKSDGDEVKPGEPLFTLESEKATENIEAIDSGILRLMPDGPKAGDNVQVGQVLAFLTAEGDQIAPDECRMLTKAGVAQPVVSTEYRVPNTQPSVSVSLPAATWKAISPRARRAARELGVNWQSLSGSGRAGRIRERDIRAASISSAGRLIPHTKIKKVIAAKMVAGVTQAAPVTLTSKADVTKLVFWREQLRAQSKTDLPSYADVILMLSAAALRRQPMLQAQWRDEGLWHPNHVHIAIAVDTDAGLLAPVVRDADKLSLREIAQRTRKLIEEARAGKLTAEQMAGATFTVTNLGMFGIDAFTPIIHLPQCAVLGVGRVIKEPAAIENKITPRHKLTLSLTFDHRVVDGAPAAQFLSAIRKGLEEANLG
jgi:pyruvate dehydrogenase E2 component (dihydrolipoamide acetyltransferase)